MLDMKALYVVCYVYLKVSNVHVYIKMYNYIMKLKLRTISFIMKTEISVLDILNFFPFRRDEINALRLFRINLFSITYTS